MANPTCRPCSFDSASHTFAISSRGFAFESGPASSARKPSSVASRIATPFASASSPATNMAAGVVRSPAVVRFSKPIALNAFTTRAPGNSSSDDLLELFPGARVVKAFNAIGFENLTTAGERTTPAAMFVAGDDAEAKGVAMRLATELGFRAEDAGPLSNAKPLEEMAKVWLALSKEHGRQVGFAISDG